MARMVEVMAIGLVAGYYVRRRWVWTLIGAGLGCAIGNEFAREALQRAYGAQVEHAALIVGVSGGLLLGGLVGCRLYRSGTS